MSEINIPERHDYKAITPFRLFVKSNFPFIESTYEALDNYGLYCKVVEYLNQVIDEQNKVNADMVTFTDFVTGYFENLDVQEEINNKLDEMATTGVLQQLIHDYFDEVNTLVANYGTTFSEDIENQNEEIATLVARMNTFTNLPNGSTSGDAELADARVGANGKTYTNVGTAIRSQVTDLQNEIDAYDIAPHNLLFNIGFYESGGLTPSPQEHSQRAYCKPFKTDYKMKIKVKSGTNYAFSLYSFDGVTRTTVTSVITNNYELTNTSLQYGIMARNKINDTTELYPADLDDINNCIDIIPETYSEEFSEINSDIDEINSEIVSLHNRDNEIVELHKNMLYGIETYPNKLWERNTFNLIDNSLCTAFEPVRIIAGTTYYYKDLWLLFGGIRYDDGTQESIVPNSETDPNMSGSRVFTKSGYIYLTARNNYLATAIFTDDVYVYNNNIYTEVNIIGSALSEAIDNKKVIHVEKDGSGDYIKLSDAIQYAVQFMDSTVYVGAGTYDLIDELGSTYVESINENNRGLYLKNNVHVICSSETLITWNYTGTNQDVITWGCAFNSGEYGFTLENARIESSKCRYTIHDERDIATDTYKNTYINCNFKQDNTSGGAKQCIGGGLGKDGHIVIKDCIFESVAMNTSSVNSWIVSYHNTWNVDGGRSFIDISGCYLKGNGTFHFGWFGNSTEKTPIICSNNSIGHSIYFEQETTEPQSVAIDIVNMELYEWNNVIRQ